MSHTITAEQFRMAKAALRMTNADVSEITGLHRNTLNGVDSGRGSESTLTHLRIHFISLGIEFIDANGGGPGVRLKDNQESRYAALRRNATDGLTLEEAELLIVPELRKRLSGKNVGAAGGMLEYQQLKNERPDLFNFSAEGDDWQFVQSLISKYGLLKTK